MNAITRQLKTLFAAISITILAVGAISAQEKSEKITFDDHVKPLLKQRCSSCHNSQKREGDVDVTNYTNLMQGGGSGEVIEPLDAGSSYLYKLITHEESPEMPPSGTRIPEGEIQMIAKWINGGALENKGSKAAKAKPKFDMALSESPSKRPKVIPMPLRMPIEPVIKPARPSVLAIATSPWAPITAIAAPKQILLYNTQTLQLAGVLPMEEGVAHSLRFSRNGQLLLAGGGKDGASGKTILFNVITGDRITVVGDELESVLASDISSNHELIALGGPSKLVKVFSTADGSVLYEIKKHTEWVTALEFSPDGKFLATGDRNGGMHVWEADSGNEVFTFKGHNKSISAISWRADSKIVASTSEDSTIRIWELKDGKQVKSWGSHGGGTTSLEFQRDGKLVSCGRDKVAKVWDQNGKMLKQFGGLTDVAVAVSYCDESKRVVAGAATQKHAPLAERVTTAKTRLDAVGKSLGTAKQTKIQLQTKLTQSQQQFAAAKKQFESTTTQHAQWRKELESNKSARPSVKESYDKATIALKSLPADPELKQMTATLYSKLKQIDARVTELNNLVAKTNQKKNTTKTQMDSLSKLVLTTKNEMTTVTAQVNKLQGEFTTMDGQLKKDVEAATAAKAVVDNATHQVNRWKGDIQFISIMNTLNQDLANTEKLIDEKQTLVDQANQKLDQAKLVVDQAMQQKSEIEKKADTIKQEMLKLRGGK